MRIRSMRAVEVFGIALALAALAFALKTDATVDQTSHDLNQTNQNVRAVTNDLRDARSDAENRAAAFLASITDRVAQSCPVLEIKSTLSDMREELRRLDGRLSAQNEVRTQLSVDR